MTVTDDVAGSWAALSRWFLDLPQKMVGAAVDQARASQTLGLGLMSYVADFMTPFWISLTAFVATEREKVHQFPSHQTILDYLELLQFNHQIAQTGLQSSLEALADHGRRVMAEAQEAWVNTVAGQGGEGLDEFMARQARLAETLVYAYPQAIRAIRSEYGFHFDRPDYEQVAETDRFVLWQVLPQSQGVEVNPEGKPVVIIPPYVLGANILAFLPGENKSYVHAFANQGIPTYVRIMKDIATTPAVQTMTGEDEVLDTRDLCQQVRERHGRQVTLNGFCQGGFVAVLDVLTGELDGLVDALITCVAPMDGTRSLSLVEYLQHLPPRFRDLGYAVKRLPSGNQVVDGKVMSWVYKLKSMDREAPLYTFIRDLRMIQGLGGEEVKISKTAAAINHWLIYDRGDLPESITKLSFDSYTVPVTRDGDLPVKLFGRRMNFKRIADQGLKWLICVAEADDLVDQASALAPLDFVDAEVSVFPKGHGAIATSWSLPSSECALHTRFGEDQYRGPVRFQLDLQSG
ncbi:MAG: metal transporter [Proteobacteria bacterium]|nr:metal transporter [Pseudomonadota bacterium]MBU1742505.1 metal transporter [Pseudomonadota bacterium]